MKSGLALILLFAALLAAAPALCEPGDVPGCPWVYMPATEVARLEDVRDAQVVGGVVGSPYWLWQAYLGSGSIDLRLYDVENAIFPTQQLFKERLRWNGESKTLALTVRGTADTIELRVTRDALTCMQDAGIETILIVGQAGGEVAYGCAEIGMTMDFFGLEAGEILCLAGEDAPVYKHDADGFRRALTAEN